MKAFVWKVRVYWEDTDAGGVVYHSQYLNFFERARTEWLRSLGVNQAEIAKEENFIFAISRMDIEFSSPARLDDVLLVSVHSINTGGARMTFVQDIIREQDQTMIATSNVTAVSLKADSFKPTRMLKWIRAEINNAK